jgi:hypothetical protein
LFADDLKIYRNISYVHDCKLIQSEINSAQNWCFENGMTLTVGKTAITSFTRKTVGFHFSYKLSNNPILRSQYVKDLGVLLDSKLYFHRHIDYISSQGLKVLGLILSPLLIAILFCIPPLYGQNWNMHPLPGTPLHLPIRPNSKELKKIATLYQGRFFAGVCGSKYEGKLSRLNISTLHSRRKHLDAPFLINVFKNKISCSSIFDTLCLRIPSRRIRDYSTFAVNKNVKVSPTARCVSAVNVICKEIDIFNKNKITLVDNS